MSRLPDDPPIGSSEFASLLTPLAPAPPLALAVSGGADSMALLLLAHRWSPATVALTVDHALRPESAEEARQVAAWCAERNIEHHTLLWNCDTPTGNLQAQAREARYRLMANWCKTHNITQLATAHHQNDQAETVLLRLKRGSHIEGLAAMRHATMREGIALLRPLLAIPKSRLIATLQAEGQPWIEDPSNANEEFDRIRIRQALAQLPNPAAITEQLAATATRLRALSDERTAETDAFLADHARNHSCDATALAHAEPDLAYRVLSRLLHTVGRTPYPPRFADTERLYAALIDGTLTRRTLNHCLIERQAGQLIIRPENA